MCQPLGYRASKGALFVRLARRIWRKVVLVQVANVSTQHTHADACQQVALPSLRYRNVAAGALIQNCLPSLLHFQGHQVFLAIAR